MKRGFSFELKRQAVVCLLCSFFLISGATDESYVEVFSQAAASQRAGEFERAFGGFQQALALSQKARDARAEAECLTRLGILTWNLGQNRESQEFFQRGFLCGEKAGLRDLKESCQTALDIIDLYTQGKDCRSAQQYRNSIDTFQRAIVLSRERQIPEFELKCLRQMSIAYWEMNDLDSFYSENGKALKIAREIRHKVEEGRCLNNIGLYHWKSDNYSNALMHYEEALIISRELHEPRMEAECLTNIGIIYFVLGDFNQAESLFYQSLKIDQELNIGQNICINLNNIGVTQKHKGLIKNDRTILQKSLSFFGKSLEISLKTGEEKNLVFVLNNIGILNGVLGNKKLAIEYFNRALDKAKMNQDKESLGLIKNNMGDLCLVDNELAKAILFYKEALECAGKIGVSQVSWEANLGLGKCYENMGELSLALSYYRKAAEVIDEVRSHIYLDAFKAGFARNKYEVYERIINIFFRLCSLQSSKSLEEEIFLTVEKAKARAFLESLGNSAANSLPALSPALEKRERDISQGITSLIWELSRNDLAPEIRKRLVEQLGQDENEYMRIMAERGGENLTSANFISPQVCSLRLVQETLLDERSALVEYFVGESRSWMLIVTRNDFAYYPLPPRQILEESLRAFLKILQVPGKKDFPGAAASERIGSELMSPLGDAKYSGIDTLIIVPDGVLYYLPFETLRLSSKGSSRFLIEDFKISYAPSASSLLLLATRPSPSGSTNRLLAFGSPIYTRSSGARRLIEKSSGEILREIYLNQGFDFSTLPYAKKEILDISLFFPPSQRDLYMEEMAREETLKGLPLHDYCIIHLACHGFMDENSSYRSALVLSLDDNRREDGFLQVREIYGLRLNAELVVLSACQTGRGSFEKGEGLLGLPRIFFYAGARSVVSTLWKIGDRSTAVFMKEFYRHLAGRKGKNDALRLAKIRMLRSKYSHPFYWAAFVLNGDFRSGILLP